MCGIVAAFTRLSNGFTKQHEDAFWDMLFADTLRGDDSTGIVAVHNDGSFGIAKDAYSAHWCIDEMKRTDFVKQMFGKGAAYIGHNRKATIGKIEAETAHPFVVKGTFALVHNGTLYNHKKLANTTVDSEALAIHLQKFLNDDVTKEILDEKMGEVDGAYAIIAYNQETEKVYFMRNKDRPLSILWHEDGMSLASEGPMALWCHSRNRMSVDKMKMEPVKEDTLYIVDLKTLEVKQVEFKPKKSSPPATMVVAGGSGTFTKKVVPTRTYIPGVELSKSEFKRIKRRTLSQRIEFYVDDYVEKNFPATIEQGETKLLVMGESDSLDCDHIVRGEFDISKMVAENDLRITERLFTGLVVGMDYDKDSGFVTIRVIDINPVGEYKPAAKVQATPPNTPMKTNVPALIDAKYIQQKLDEADRNANSSTLH